MKRAEEKQQFNNLRPFLVWRFLLHLFLAGVTEILLVSLLNKYVFPVMTQTFWKDLTLDRNLSNVALLGLLGLLLLEILVLAIGYFLPRSLDPLVYSLANGLEGRIYRQLPELSKNAVLRLSAGKEFLLFCMLVLILVVLLLPLAIAAGLYATEVAKEINRMEQIREEQYVENDRQRNLMLSDIAHDLRTPITTVSGYAKALHDGMVKDEEKKQEYLEAIMNKSARMEDLIQLLFEYSKINSAGFTLHKQRGDLAELVRENVALMYDDVEHAGMELEISLPEEYCPVSYDKLQLGRVITNLISNAIKHNEAGTRIGVSLYWDEEEEKYMVEIADSGKAISPEVAENLFEPFAVGDESRSSKGGSGLGLSIAYRIVEMHGGNLHLEEKGKSYTKAFVFDMAREEE